MNTLIVYYSFTGNNHKLAKYMQEKLNCDVLNLEETKKRTIFKILVDFIFKRKAKLKYYYIAPADYDMVILISPIWCGELPSPIKTFVSQEKQNIKKLSHISLCAGGEKQRAKTEVSLNKLWGKKPTTVQEIEIKKFLLPADNANVDKMLKFKLNDNQLNEVESEIVLFLNSLN